MCENIDWNVGRLINKLRELELEENTIVLYLSDNGPNGHRWNGGMKGIKGFTDEGGVRSPLFIQWTGVIKPGMEIGEIAAAIDLLPTLADLAGIRARDRKAVGWSEFEAAAFSAAGALDRSPDFLPFEWSHQRS
jgi:arylsulfatase A-like enzyme